MELKENSLYRWEYKLLSNRLRRYRLERTDLFSSMALNRQRVAYYFLISLVQCSSIFIHHSSLFLSPGGFVTAVFSNVFPIINLQRNVLGRLSKWLCNVVSHCSTHRCKYLRLSLCVHESAWGVENVRNQATCLSRLEWKAENEVSSNENKNTCSRYSSLLMLQKFSEIVYFDGTIETSTALRHKPWTHDIEIRQLFYGIVSKIIESTTNDCCENSCFDSNEPIIVT